MDRLRTTLLAVAVAVAVAVVVAVVACTSGNGGSAGSGTAATDSETAGTSGLTESDGGPTATSNDTDACTGGPPAPTPLCSGNGCLGACGCFSCEANATACPILGGPAPFLSMVACNDLGNCEDEVPCATGRTCILLEDLLGACSDALDCEGVTAFYAALVGLDDGCQTDDQCRVLNGHCTQGLGDCYHFLGPHTFNGDFFTTQAVLDELASQWTELGCMAQVCTDCPAAPAGAVCESGTCVAAP